MYIKHLHRDLISKIYFTFFLSIRTSRTTNWKPLLTVYDTYYSQWWHNSNYCRPLHSKCYLFNKKENTNNNSSNYASDDREPHARLYLITRVVYSTRTNVRTYRVWKNTARRSAKIFASARLVVSRDVQTLADVCYGFCCADAIIIITTVS